LGHTVFSGKSSGATRGSLQHQNKEVFYEDTANIRLIRIIAFYDDVMSLIKANLRKYLTYWHLCI
jgi:hypothetical protein